MVKQNIIVCQTKSVASPLWVGLTHEILAKYPTWHDSSFSNFVLCTWLFSQVSYSRKPLVHPLKLEYSPISHTHLLQLIPHTYREKMIEEITIKFGMELKPI